MKISKSIVDKITEKFKYDENDAVQFSTVAIESIERNIAKIEECIFKGDYANLIFPVHNLKGNLGTMGLTEEASMASRIQSLIEFGDISKAIQLCAELKSRLIEVD